MAISSQNGNRVVITGLGPVTPVGLGADDFWSSLMQGTNGVGPITHYDASEHRTQIAAEIKDFPSERFVTKKEIKRMDRFCMFALAAAQLAMEDGGLEEGVYDPSEVGVITGSGVGGILTTEKQCEILHERGPGRVTPFLIPQIIANMSAGLISMRYGFTGPNTCVVTACAAGTHAIGDAARLIRTGEAKAMLAGGNEAAIVPIAMAGFCSLKAMSTRNDDPSRASRPFDKERDGFVMGEGAGIVLLEEYASAKKRGAKIYAEVVGYGMTGDAHHMTAPSPDGSGVAKAMEIAIAQSGLALEDFGYINAHGTSTAMNDKFETMGIKRVFGDLAHKLMISSTKGMTGHLIGAAGGIETITCALAIDRGSLPPTINYEFPDPDCDLDYIPNEAREVKIKAAINSNLGFGGHNAVIALAAV